MPEAKSKDECDFDEPWSIYADRDEPWKDYELLLKLDDQMAYQYEIADALGTSPSTISYWLNKAKEEYQPEPDDEKLKCERFEVCGNRTAGTDNGLCDVCLDLVRQNQTSQRLERTNFESMNEYQEALYDEFEECAEKRQQAHDEFYGEDEDEVHECEECGEEMNYVSDLDTYICSNCTATTEA